MTIFLTQTTEGEGFVSVYCLSLQSMVDRSTGSGRILRQPECVGAEFLHLILNRKEKAKNRGEEGAKGRERNRNRGRRWREESGT